MGVSYDFSGWATKNDLRCSDGRTIRKDAFKHNDGQTVPLVWNHKHDDPLNVLGHALLENRKDGVYAYCSFNDTESAKSAREAVKHGDVKSLSIYANNLQQSSTGDVLHGAIREVSLVLAGANPGAFIDDIIDDLEIEHSYEDLTSAEIYTGEDLVLEHADKKEPEEQTSETEEKTEEKPMAENTQPAKSEDEETIQDVFDTLTDKQKEVVYAIVGQALADAAESNEQSEQTESNEQSEQGEQNMKHNVFDGTDEYRADVLSHSEMESILRDAKHSTLKEAVLAHGIDDIDYLFPDAKNVTDTPEFIKREDAWVSEVMGSTHHTPFSRIKSIFADITMDTARAKGYIKGHYKVEEQFALLKRTTTPTTIYKKQKLDRDDIVDITDFDVVAWLKSEMRGMLDEEIARAILIGDGRSAADEDKINEINIRPIWTDADMYTIKQTVEGTTAAEQAENFIDSAVRARKNYKGSGTPTLFATEDIITECLLLKDTIGHKIYKSMDELATAMRVSKIVTVPVMENRTRTADDKTYTLDGIIVNLADYNVGADKGGAVSLFDDFDIDYNAQKYLIETRCSGALIKPYSAIALETVSSTNAG